MDLQDSFRILEYGTWCVLVMSEEKKKGCQRRIRVRQDTENINTKLKTNFSFSPHPRKVML